MLAAIATGFPDGRALVSRRENGSGRGETAALRSLANAAHMIERNPNLMQLRLLQVLGQQSGNTVVLGVPATSGPIPIRGSSDQPQISGDVAESTES